MTHLFDSSASLANLFGEPGMDRVRALLEDSDAEVGISVLTLYEVFTRVMHRTGSKEVADQAVATLRQAVAEIVPIDEEIVDLAIDLRRDATARIALADCLIAATAAHRGATLVHRDPHFAALPAGRPTQETLLDKS